MEGVCRRATFSLYVSKSMEKSVVLLQKYVTATESRFPLLQTLRNTSFTRKARREINVPVTDPNEVMEGLQNMEKDKKLGVVHGPPGCGKTFTGVRLALSLCASENSETVLFIARRNLCVDDFMMKCIDESNGVLNYKNVVRLGKRVPIDENISRYYFKVQLFGGNSRQRQKKYNRPKSKAKNESYFGTIRKVEKNLSIRNYTVRKDLRVQGSEISKAHLPSHPGTKASAKSPLILEKDFRYVNISPEPSEVSKASNNINYKSRDSDEEEGDSAQSRSYFSIISNLETFASEDMSSQEGLHRSDSVDQTLRQVSQSDDDFMSIFSSDDEDESLPSLNNPAREKYVSFNFCDVPLNFRHPPPNSSLFKKDSSLMNDHEKRDYVFTRLRQKFEIFMAKVLREYRKGL